MTTNWFNHRQRHTDDHENINRLTCDDRRPTTLSRRHTSTVRPVHQHRHADGSTRRCARTYSVPNAAGPSADVDAVTVRHRASLQYNARDVDKSRAPAADYVRVRSFSTSSRSVKNRGDSFKRRHNVSSASFDETHSTDVNCLLMKMNDLSGPTSPPPPPAAAACDLKVVVVGDASVGKRSIISQFTTSEYMHGTTDYSPTSSGYLAISRRSSAQQFCANS